jgi:mRNA-degrading endonuclease toxin of MazEF toxin-antitoxin module
MGGSESDARREQAGLRPVLVLSHDVFTERSGTVIAVALTSQAQRAGFPLTLEIEGIELPKRSWAKISQIRTLGCRAIGQATRKGDPGGARTARRWAEPDRRLLTAVAERNR